MKSCAPSGLTLLGETGVVDDGGARATLGDVHHGDGNARGIDAAGDEIGRLGHIGDTGIARQFRYSFVTRVDRIDRARKVKPLQRMDQR